ncbi:MAG: hypothetical protein CSB55_01165 [Candidatus Cloacimonadota bacterium]|nr:MAG: hypothetical protein CSB55_01165 [Candidatus Cloacimonadota bacterium]
MRKIIFALFAMNFALVLASDWSYSGMYAGSYLQRSNGIYAIGENPANIMNREKRNDFGFLMGLNFNAYNNSMSMNKLNNVSGKYLDEEDKEKFIGDLDGSLRAGASFSNQMLACSRDNWGFSVSTFGKIKAKISKKYFDLIFFGNEYGEQYLFTEKNNSLDAISYTDIAFAYQTDLQTMIPSLRENERMPTVRVGFAADVLIGLGTAETTAFKGVFDADEGGLDMKNEIHITRAESGIGQKFIIGFAVEPIENLSAGLVFDNIFGKITWNGNTEEDIFTVNSDSIYLAEISEDFYTQTDTTSAIGNFSTSLPLIIKLGALYQILPDWNASIDFQKGMKNESVWTDELKVSVATEYFIKEIIPLAMGFQNGTNDRPYRLSYGFGIRPEFMDLDFSVSSFGAFFPGNSVKGVGFNFNARWKF